MPKKSWSKFYTDNTIDFLEINFKFYLEKAFSPHKQPE